MSEQAGIANSIDIAKQEAQYDSCAKKLLSNNIILAWILKECVPEFKQYSVAQIANDCIEGEPQVSKVAVDQDQLDKDELEYLEDMSDKSIEGKNTEDNSVKEADAMCNLGQGIRERAFIESTGNTIIKIMINKNLSFDDAYDSIYCEEDRDDLKAYVDEHMAVAK